MQSPNNQLPNWPGQQQQHVHHHHHHHHGPLHSNNSISSMSLLYKRVIIHALQELQDYHHRSNIDSIRRKAQTSMEVGHEWNETMFLKALKNLVESGEIEKCNPAHGHISTCELSPEMKKKVTSKAQQVIHNQQLQQRQAQQLQQLQQLQYELQQLLQWEEYQRQLEYAREQFYRLPPPLPPAPVLQTTMQPPQLPQLQQQLPTGLGGRSTSINGGGSKSHRRHSFDALNGASTCCRMKNAEKEAAKKTEHFKEKIIPKKLYDHMFVPIKNPMQMD
jgi:hypothetical protein